MKENYYALLLCILKPVTIDQSFMLLEGNFKSACGKKRGRRKLDLNNKDLVADRNNGMTFQQIGDKYGISKNAAMVRIKRCLKEVTY